MLYVDIIFLFVLYNILVYQCIHTYINNHSEKKWIRGRQLFVFAILHYNLYDCLISDVGQIDYGVESLCSAAKNSQSTPTVSSKMGRLHGQRLQSIHWASVWEYTLYGHATIDESMIKLKGRLSFQQYLPAEPIKWGTRCASPTLDMPAICRYIQARWRGSKRGVGPPGLHGPAASCAGH